MYSKKSLGQNFLIDQNVIKKIIDLSEIKGKNIIEIGSGKGALTSEIIKRKTTAEIHDDNIISEFSQLKFGDLVVHIDHGVGKFNCLTKKKINNFEQEFIELLYYNNDKLLIPIENLELISKYE
mgnify:CR=1 FL=1